MSRIHIDHFTPRKAQRGVFSTVMDSVSGSTVLYFLPLPQSRDLTAGKAGCIVNVFQKAKRSFIVTSD